MPYGFKVELGGVDITEKVAAFEIVASFDSFCRELSFSLSDQALYDSIEFGQLPESPQVEVFTKTGTTWVSQGTFFIEKPTFTVGINETTTGVWGRSAIAVMGSPWALRVRKTWETDTTFFSIAEEMCEAAGVSWDAQYCEIDDFTVYAYSFKAEGAYPIEVISSLVELVHGDGAVVGTDRAGHLVIRRVDRSPTVSDFTVDDDVTVGIAEEPEWPDFGNRIRISAAGGVGGFNVAMTTPIPCLVADGTTRAKIYARVTDADGNPQDNVPVLWRTEHSLVSLDTAASNTQTVIIPGEKVRSKNFYQIELNFPPKVIRGIYAEKDVGRTINLADGGYVIDGNVVNLLLPLRYCDQAVRVIYTCEGVAVNYAETGLTAGVEKITADAFGNVASIELYIDNPCMCPPSIRIEARPTGIDQGQWAAVLTYVEIGGAPVLDGRIVYNTIDTSPSHGTLEWTSQSLGQVEISEEQATVINEIEGISQCEMQMFAASVTGVYECFEDEEGNLQPTGLSIYASNDGKLINLSKQLITGTIVLIDYVAVGAAINVFEGVTFGTDRIRAILTTTREEPTEAETQITVNVEGGGGGDDPPPGCCNNGLCQTEDVPCGQAAIDCAAMGGVHGMSNGQAGCFPVGELDLCGEDGNVYCFVDGGLQCVPSDQCDTTAGADQVRCKKAGTDGCFQPEECDPCGPDGKVYCYKGGVMGCNAPGECDKGTGSQGEIECEGTTKCCENAEGVRGCWEPDQCASDPPKPPDKPPFPPDKPKPPANCVGADGKKTSCAKGQSCCAKNGVRGCHASADCDKPPDYCYSTDCHKDASPDCLSTRFGSGFQDGGDGCSCLEMCDKEMSMYGTTQGYDGGSYRQIFDIVQTLGYTYGTPEFNEKYEELKQEAMDQCRQECGDCETEETQLILQGPEEVSSPGGFQYTVSGGRMPYQWSAGGSGASIDNDGFLTLAPGACGAVHITVNDSCGRHVSMDARITNHGAWVQVNYEYASCHYYAWSGCETGESTCIQGKYRYHEVTGTCPPNGGLGSKCGCYNSKYGIGIRITDEWKC